MNSSTRGVVILCARRVLISAHLRVFSRVDLGHWIALLFKSFGWKLHKIMYSMGLSRIQLCHFTGWFVWDWLSFVSFSRDLVLVTSWKIVNRITILSRDFLKNEFFNDWFNDCSLIPWGPWKKWLSNNVADWLQNCLSYDEIQICKLGNWKCVESTWNTCNGKKNTTRKHLLGTPTWLQKEF